MDFFNSNYTHVYANLWSLYECGMNVIGFKWKHLFFLFILPYFNLFIKQYTR
jgi:hypothetical protein